MAACCFCGFSKIVAIRKRAGNFYGSDVIFFVVQNSGCEVRVKGIMTTWNVWILSADAESNIIHGNGKKLVRCAKIINIALWLQKLRVDTAFEKKNYDMEIRCRSWFCACLTSQTWLGQQFKLCRADQLSMSFFNDLRQGDQLTLLRYEVGV